MANEQLIRLIKAGDLTQVREYLQTENVVYDSTDTAETPLLLALRLALSEKKGDFLRIAIYLLTENPSRAEVVKSINKKSKTDYSSLDLAVKLGSLQLVQLLVDAGAEYSVTKKGRTPLMLAIDGYHAAVAIYLLQSRLQAVIRQSINDTWNNAQGTTVVRLMQRRMGWKAITRADYEELHALLRGAGATGFAADMNLSAFDFVVSSPRRDVAAATAVGAVESTAGGEAAATCIDAISVDAAAGQAGVIPDDSVTDGDAATGASSSFSGSNVSFTTGGSGTEVTEEGHSIGDTEQEALESSRATDASINGSGTNATGRFTGDAGQEALESSRDTDASIQPKKDKLKTFKSIYAALREGQSGGLFCLNFFKTNWVRKLDGMENNAALTLIEERSKKANSRTARAWALTKDHCNSGTATPMELFGGCYQAAWSASGIFARRDTRMRKQNLVDAEVVAHIQSDPSSRAAKVMKELGMSINDSKIQFKK